jgi:hypothetical protein
MFGMTHHVEKIINIWIPCKREVTRVMLRLARIDNRYFPEKAF